MQRHGQHLSIGASAALAICAGWAQASLAQTAPAAAAADSSATLEEVVVTAEHRSANIQTTAISMSALSSSDLADKDVQSVADLQQAVPSLAVNPTGFSSNINIRGFGDANTSSPNTTTGVAVYRDGMLEPEPILQNEALFDLADVEVLRGPQGTFVGQNSTAGAVMINSNDPKLGDTRGALELQGGSYADVAARGMINLPLSDTLALRTAVNVERRNSFYTDINPDNPTRARPGDLREEDLRVGALWAPTSEFTSVIKAEYSDVYTDGLTPKPIPGTPYAAFAPTDPYVVNYGRTDLLDEQTVFRVSLRNEYHFGDDGLTLRSLSNGQYGDVRRVEENDASSTQTSYDLGDVHDIKYFGQEFDLLWGTQGPLTWTTGATYFHRDTPASLDNYNAAEPFSAAAPFIVHIRIHTLTAAEGVFAQLSYQLSDSLQLQVGGRYSWQQNRETGSIQAGPVTIPTTGSFRTQVPTGKVALNWTPVEGQFLYAFAARGFKAGGVNNAVSTFGNETDNDYELGWKTTLLGGNLRVQADTYYMQYHGLQEISVDPLTGSDTLVSNVGNATVKGVELTAQGRVGALSIDGGLAYSNSRLGAIRLIDGPALPDGGAGTLGPQCGSGQVANCFNYNPYYANLSGIQNTFSPTWTGNISLSYAIPLANATLRPRVNFSYVDRQYATLFQSSPLALIPSRSLYGAQLEYERDRWRAVFYATNLGDRAYIVAKSGDNQFYGAPRQFGVRLAFDF